MGFDKSAKQANSHHPRCVTLLIDNSGSMEDNGKCQQVTDAVQDMVITMQSLNMGAHGCRFILSIGKFGDTPTELTVAKCPAEVDVDSLVFDGASGGTDMLPALRWAETAIRKSLERCRKLPIYQEELAPNPICVFLSDGECTGEDPIPAAKALRAIPFKDGEIDVFAVGVGLLDQHFEVMKSIASKPEYAIRIGPEGIADLLGDIGGTVFGNEDAATLVAKVKAR